MYQCGMPGLTDMSQLPEKTYDLLIIGMGPAGVACALQARRDGLELLTVSEEAVGGLVRAARRLDNLPAAPSIAGAKLADKLFQQVEATRIPVIASRVSGLSRNGASFRACLADGIEVMARAVVLATGTRPRGWKAGHFDAGVHRDIRTLAASLAGQKVAVVGGGEAALDSALSCCDRGAEVAVLVRGPQPRVTGRLLAEALENGVEIHCSYDVDSVSGDRGAWCLKDGSGKVVEAHELMVCIGRLPCDGLASELVASPVKNGIFQEACPGLMLAGDLIRGQDRYVATAMGDGQRAAVGVARYLQKE